MSDLGLSAQNVALKVEDAQVEVPEWFTNYLRAALSQTFRTIPDTTVSWLADKVALFGNPVPVGQLIGFSQFTIKEATTVSDNDATSSVYPAYVDLAHAGPVLTGLPDGRYLFWFGAQAKNSVGDASLMGLNVNGTSPNNGNSAATNSSVYTQIMAAFPASLTAGGNNTVTAQYSVGAGTGNFSLRFLYGLRVSNT